MTLRNTGDQDAPATQVQLELPLEALFVDVDGLPQPTIDPHDKIISAQVDLRSGGEHRFQFRMVVPCDAGGNLLTPHLRVHALYLGADFSSGAQFDIDSAIHQRPRAPGVTGKP